MSPSVPETTIWGFNPTLVRLRPRDVQAAVRRLAYGFNPTLVRLRPSIGFCLWLMSLNDRRGGKPTILPSH